MTLTKIQGKNDFHVEGIDDSGKEVTQITWTEKTWRQTFEEDQWDTEIHVTVLILVNILIYEDNFVGENVGVMALLAKFSTC